MIGNVARIAGAALALALTPVGAGVGAAAAVSHATEVEAEKAEKVKADNHGDYVREQREAGLRGRDLAGAIHEEKGNQPPGFSKERGQPATGKGKGRTDHHSERTPARTNRSAQTR